MIITVEELQARMKGCQVLVSLLDRKATLLGMDALAKTEPPPIVPPETKEQRARAPEAHRPVRSSDPLLGGDGLRHESDTFSDLTTVTGDESN